MTLTRRYTFKLYPNATQLAAIDNAAVLCARLWNAALEQREIQWSHECQRKPRGERRGLSFFDQSPELKFIRADDPAYAELSADTLSLVVKSLDLAFKAFFRRAKGGAGKSSGYPKYKSARHADTVPFRDAPKGWKLIPFGEHFKVRCKGIPGEIKARGKFPANPTDIRSMELIKRDGAWWASIVVFMEERRSGGHLPVSVNMDLIDKFAEVQNKNTGKCLAGLTVESYSAEGRISQHSQSVMATSGAVTGGMRADDRESANRCRCDRGAVTGECGLTTGLRLTHTGAVTGDLIDRITSERDRRFKKFSYRWRKETKRIAKLKTKQARQRAHRLHNWSSAVIQAAKEIEVITPPVSDLTKSARGTVSNPGAAVDTVAKTNRKVLDYAPAAAVAMLEYKAAEAGIPIAVIKASDHSAYIGQDISAVAKIERKTRAKLKRQAA